MVDLPPPTSDRDYESSPPPTDPPDLYPNSPRGREMVEAFKQTIATHMADMEGKTTDEFLNPLALDLWRATRYHS